MSVNSYLIQTVLITTAGDLKYRTSLIPLRRIAHIRPMAHAQNVDEGILGSSVLATAA
jgi:hypothetical protein